MKGFGFSRYRSFGNRHTKIAPLRKINFIIGRNNVGKSNIINFLCHQYPYFLDRVSGNNFLSGKEESPYKKLDRPLMSGVREPELGFPLYEKEWDEFLEKKLPEHNRAQLSQFAKRIFSSDSFLSDGAAWFWYGPNPDNTKFGPLVEPKALESALEHWEWKKLWSALTNQTGGGMSHWVPETLRTLAYHPGVPKIEIIPAIRKVGPAGTEAKGFGGEGIIDRLARIQNPSVTQQEQKEKFSNINRFAQVVLENGSARIEIPYERNMIIVHMHGRSLPLSSLGTGVHEVIILASAATLLENAILCVEEPELHLHPLLQRKLIRYLSTDTNNQYIFTTHSAHLLDAVQSEVFHVTMEGNESLVRAVSSTKEKSLICHDLGYRASDILQANCIVWVEGPSDRIYLNAWIKEKNLSLVEGIHYSIMFYGGRLFSHISGLDESESEALVEDLISVRKLNRNSVILFDSDKSSPRKAISATKQRLQREFDSGPGFAWITKGREVENYLPPDKLEASVKEIHPSASSLCRKGKWDNLLIYKKKYTGEERAANKVKVARHYVENNVMDLNNLDLAERVDELVEFIKHVNSES